MKVHEFMHEMQTTSAVLGRTSNISVIFEGDEAKTDGKTIYLPALPQQVDLTPEQVLAMRGYVDHEAGHNRHSDMPRIMSFYDKNHNNGRPELSKLHNSLEDVYMEQRVIDEYPGAWKNLRQGHEGMRQREWAILKDWDQQQIDETILKDPNLASQIAINCNKGEDFAGEYNENVRNTLPDNLDACGKHWAGLARDCADSNEVIELAKKVYQYIHDTPPEAQSPEDFDQKNSEGELSEMEGEEGEGDNSGGYGKGGEADKRAQAAARRGEAEGEGEGDGDGDQTLDPSGDISEILNSKKEIGPGSGAIGTCMDNGLRGGYKVQTTEYDCYYKRGTNPKPSNFSAHVQKVVNDTEHTSHYDKRKGELRSDVMVMKNKLRRALMAKQQRDWDFGRENGRLDSKRLVAASQGSRAVYKRRTDREDHDTAITVLIDLSGSMGGTKAQVARDCVIALTECFEGTQMKYRIAGFSNNGYGYGNEPPRGHKYHRYERLDHSIFKDYDDSLRVTRGSVFLIPNAIGGNNSDYDFVNKELFDLSRRPEARKVLFVLSDGNVACHSDAPMTEHQRLMAENLAYYQSRYGVENLGIGILDSTVKKIYKNNVVVNNVGQLSGAVFGKLTDLLLKEVK